MPAPEHDITTGNSSDSGHTSRFPMKDFMIPISIVIAGLFVGSGLYFGGGQAAPAAPQAVAQNDRAAEQEREVNTDAVDPVTADDHIKGSLDAPVKIVEFSDYDCPFCGRFHDVMNEIVEEYPATEVAWVYRHFPLEQIHPQAPAVAVAAECVAELGGNDAFWIFSDGYFAARGSGDETPHGELIPALVAEAGVASQPFSECFESGRHESTVQAHVSDAVETGGRGTPWSIIIGPSGKTYPVNGALPKQAVKQLIEAAQNDA